MKCATPAPGGGVVQGHGGERGRGGAEGGRGERGCHPHTDPHIALGRQRKTDAIARGRGGKGCGGHASEAQGRGWGYSSVTPSHTPSVPSTGVGNIQGRGY